MIAMGTSTMCMTRSPAMVRRKRDSEARMWWAVAAGSPGLMSLPRVTSPKRPQAMLMR